MASMIKQDYKPMWKSPRDFPSRDAKGFPIGVRTKERLKQNAKLNKLPDSVKKRCEIQLPGCLGDKFLSWCHATKSRFLLTDKDWQRAARGCAICHQKIEQLPHSEMAEIVDRAIRSRK